MRTRLEFGNNVWINSGSKLICCKHITIGDNSIISWDVEIRDSDIHSLSSEGFVVQKKLILDTMFGLGAVQ